MATTTTNPLLSALQIARPGYKPQTLTPPAASPMPIAPPVTATSSTLPPIPSLPPIYSGPAADTYEPQISEVQTDLNTLKSAIEYFDEAHPDNWRRAKIDAEGKMEANTRKLNDLIAAQLSAKQGAQANINQQINLAALPGLEDYLSQNLTGQTRNALTQLQPLIEQRLNALGILDSGALAATQSKAESDLLQSQQARIGDFMTGALGSSTLGLAGDQYQNTIQALLGATQRSFAMNDVASERDFAMQMQRQAMQAQKDMMMPFWQQLMLSSAGGASQGLGSGLGAYAGKRFFGG